MHCKFKRTTKDMRRILIIGNAGAGKTTFARELALKLNIPLVHLDKLYWTGEWDHLSKEDFDTVLQGELEKPEWIIDGNFNRTIPHRLNYCDTVIFFDFPAVKCLWGVTKRLIQNYGKSRDDMGGNCVERLDRNKMELYHHVWNFNKEHRAHYYELLKEHEDVQIVIFNNRRQVRNFLK